MTSFANTLEDNVQPEFILTIEGDADIGRQIPISSYTVTNQVNKVPSAKVIIVDGTLTKNDFELSSGGDFIPGKKVAITARYTNSTVSAPIFEGVIVKHSIKTNNAKQAILILDLKDEVIKLTVGRKNRYHSSKNKDSDIIKELVNPIDPNAIIESTNISVKDMVQYYCTDWDFICHRSDINGKLVIVNNGKVSVKAPSLSVPSINIKWGFGTYDFEGEIDARDQYNIVSGHSFDFSNEENYLASFTSNSTDNAVERVGSQTSSSLASVIGLEDFELSHSGFIDPSEIESWAKAKLMRSRLAKVTGKVKVQGNAEVQVGQTISIEGYSEQFNGEAWISGVSHSFDTESNWFTTIQFGLSQEWYSTKYQDIIKEGAAGLVPEVKGLLNGVVTEIDNSDNPYHVRVHIPVMDITSKSQVGVWARVGQLDAGLNEKGGDKQRGTFFYPQVGDEVIVGFFNNDPRDPVVLGSLYSETNIPPVPTTNHDVKGFVSREQFKILVDDNTKSVTVETPNENKVTLDDEKKSITLEDQHGNKIIMDDKGISIESSKDLNLKAAATGAVNISGNEIGAEGTKEVLLSANQKAALVQLSGTATAAIKGNAQTAIG